MIWVVRAYLALAAAAAVATIIGLFLPATVRVERSVLIERPAATVYTLAARPATFPEWAPFATASEGYRFSGPEMGVGAAARWTTRDGRRARLMVVAAEPYALVESEVDFGARGPARLALTATPQEGGVRATWALEARFGLNVVKRYVGLGLDQRVGRDLEIGLERLKAVAETTPPADFADSGADLVTLEALPIAYVERTVRGDAGDHEAAFAEALAQVRRFLDRRDLAEAGPVYAVTLEWRPPVWRFRVAAPYQGATASGEGPVALGRSPEGLAVRAVHEGDGRGAAALYDKLDAYIAARRMTAAGPVWEAMIDERRGRGADAVTEIFIPIESAGAG